MAKKRKRAKTRPYDPPESFPRPPIDDLIEEGVLIAASGVRLAVKNLAIVRVLRDRAEVNDDWYHSAVVDQLEIVAVETGTNAERVVEAIENVVERPLTTTLRPYLREPERLDIRKEMLTGLAVRLRALAADDVFVDGVAHASRDAALDEIRGAITAAALRSIEPPETLVGGDRAIALATLGMELHELQHRH